jgi:hypothetical protein
MTPVNMANPHRNFSLIIEAMAFFHQIGRARDVHDHPLPYRRVKVPPKVPPFWGIWGIPQK